MVFNHKLVWTGICLLGFANFVVLESFWTEWVPIGVCTAKQCNCKPDNQNETCSFGKVREFRFCNRSAGDPPCRDQSGVGPVRINDKCENNGVNCPGWSEWRDIGLPCNCVKDSKFRRQVIKERVCDNPPFLYGSLKCFVESDGKMDGDVQRDWRPDERCTCEVTTLPTTTSTTPPTTNRACVDAFFNNEEEYEYENDAYKDKEDENDECNYAYYG